MRWYPHTMQAVVIIRQRHVDHMSAFLLSGRLPLPRFYNSMWRLFFNSLKPVTHHYTECNLEHRQRKVFMANPLKMYLIDHTVTWSCTVMEKERLIGSFYPDGIIHTQLYCLICPCSKFTTGMSPRVCSCIVLQSPGRSF